MAERIDVARIGEAFQELTKYHPGRPPFGAPWNGRAPGRKAYPASCRRIALPDPTADDGPGLWDVMRRRRSVRRYVEGPLDLPELSQILWTAQGLTGGYRFRTAPSAGALHPIETYVVVNEVTTLERGLYHYFPAHHTLTLIKAGDLRDEIARAALGQEMCRSASVVLVWTAVIGRCAQKYAQRAYRYIYLDAGHIAQNVALACVALKLGSCQIGALYDDEVNAILGVDGHDETVLYMTAIGPIGEA